MQSCSQYCFRCIKVRRQRYQSSKKSLVSIAAAKKNTLKGKDVLDNLRSSKTEEYHHHNNIDSIKDNQEGFTLESKCNKDYKRKFYFLTNYW